MNANADIHSRGRGRYVGEKNDTDLSFRELILDGYRAYTHENIPYLVLHYDFIARELLQSNKMTRQDVLSFKLLPSF